MLKEYAQIKQNMDLQEQLHLQMKQGTDQRMMGNASALHGSDPSGGGVSAFRGGASTDGTQDIGIPGDKFIVGNESASEIVQSNDMSGMNRAFSGGNNDDI